MGRRRQHKRPSGKANKGTGQIAPLQNHRLQHLKVYGYVAAVTAVMATIMFVSRGVYPFGDSELRYTDGQQYFGVLSYLQRSFFTNDDLLYSWSRVLGGPMFSTYAYYAASPFNVVVLLFPNNLMTAYHFIFFLKFISAALCFAVMLVHMFPSAEAKAVVLFSCSYPYMGYMTFYAWNQSWMDGIIFLPLIVLGLWHIINGRGPLLYTAALAVTLLSNAYIGYMICIASVLFFISGMILAYRSFDIELLKTLVRYIIWSLAGVLLAAVLLLPVVGAFPETRTNSLADLLNNVGFLVKPDEILSMLYTAPINNMKWEDNYPVIYTGITQFILAVLFFLNRDVPRRYKAVTGVLLLIFGVSFAVSVLNVAWHGFTTNVWFNFRYSFLVSFVLELAAFYSFSHIAGAKDRLLPGGAIVLLIAVITLRAPKDNIGAGTMFFDILWVVSLLTILHIYVNKLDMHASKGAMACYLLIAGITFTNLLQNSYYSLRGLNSMSEYMKTIEVDRAITDVVNDDGFYRLGSTRRYGTVDPMRIGYAGVENFASTESWDVIEFSNRVGLATTRDHARSYYDLNVPFATDTLLGIRYVVTNNARKDGFFEDIGQVPNTDLTVYYNKYALPVLFPTHSIFDTENAELNKLEFLNGCWNSVSQKGGDIFVNTNCTVEKTPASDGVDISIQFTAKCDGPVYAFIPEGGDLETDMPITEFHFQDLFYLGDYASGQHDEFVIHATDAYTGTNGIRVYSENLSALAAKADEVLASHIEVEKQTSSNLTLQYKSEKAGILSSTIPYDEGWHAYIDDEEVETYRNMDTFLAFDVAKGSHEIQLRYWPPYLTLGIIVSVSTMAAILLWLLWNRRKVQHTQRGANTVDTGSRCGKKD